jgi:hypothetical protein
MEPESLVELVNINLQWFFSCYMCAQMGRQMVRGKGDGTEMTNRANVAFHSQQMKK